MRNSIKFGTIALAAVLGGGVAVADSMPGKMAKTEARAEVPADVARLFAKVDANKDGFITDQELGERKEQRIEKAQNRAEHFDGTRLMAKFDVNKDGAITRAEAEAGVAAHKAAKGKEAGGNRVDRMFARADANKDGKLTLPELTALKPSDEKLQRMAQGHGGPMTRMLGTADKNKDGKVSLAEAQALAIQQFDMADTNRDGQVTPDERKAARQKMRAERHPG